MEKGDKKKRVNKEKVVRGDRDRVDAKVRAMLQRREQELSGTCERVRVRTSGKARDVKEKN